MALTDILKTGLEAAILEYLTAEGGRFARTVAAFKEEAQLPDVSGGNAADNALVNDGTAMEKVWTYLHSRLIAKGPPNDEWPCTEDEVFFEAIEEGDVVQLQTSVQLYTCVGIDVKTLRCRCDYIEETPLYWAAKYNQLAIVENFVKCGHDKDEGRDDGASPLLIAADEGHVAVVQYLVEQGADKDKARDDGVTPFISACIHGHVDVAEYLLDQGCDRDHADKRGWTALHYAARYGRLNVARVLFRYGAKLDALDNQGRTPADIATARGHHVFIDAIRVEQRWVDRRMAMFLALKARVAEGAEQPILARLRAEIVRQIVHFI